LGGDGDESGGCGMRARFPSDLDRADQILAGLTARQLGILGAGILVMWATFMSLHDVLSIVGAGAACAPIGVCAGVLSAHAPDGTPMERFLWRAFRYVSSPKRLVLAPSGIAERARWRRRIGAIGLPVRAVTPEGFLDLGKRGTAALCRASAVHYHLRSKGERAALARAMGRGFNSLERPVQILVAAHPIDAESLVADLERNADYLPHPRLSAACRQYTEYFRSLLESRDVLRHEVFVVFREEGSPGEAAVPLEQRVEEFATQLREMGVRLERLGGKGCESALMRIADPGSPSLDDCALSSEPVRAGS
jgi:hypothetical protein